MKKYSKYSIATGIAILFHLFGVIGILFTPYKAWFVNNSSFTLLLMAVLLIWVQENKNLSFYLFVLFSFLVGMGVEIIGVNTGKLFGNYYYGEVLGPKFKGVPLIIGVNWFTVVFASNAIIEQIHNWVKNRTIDNEKPIPSSLLLLSCLIDGALLAMFFDWVMEPVAIKLQFWSWVSNEVPLFNYVCWFLISLVLLLLIRVLKFNRNNLFAIQLFLIQILFFWALKIFL